MNPKDFKHCLKIQIRYKDVDKQGHVNNANHLSYFENARIDYFKQIFKKPIDWNKNGLIIAHIELDYKQPIFLEDDVNCYTKVTRIGTKSFELTNLLTKIKNDASTGSASKETICAEGKTVIVCLNYDTNTTTEIPAEWIIEMNKYEGI